MPISEKIIAQINNIDADEEFKELMLSILEEEDKGNFRFKDTYEKLVNDYLEKKGGEIK
ncbi:MAG: hypothetical protein IJY86_08365 [Clostridia bacterium]|nr:hypothetical protein [Clostridia bacterium]